MEYNYFNIIIMTIFLIIISIIIAKLFKSNLESSRIEERLDSVLNNQKLLNNKTSREPKNSPGEQFSLRNFSKIESEFVQSLIGMTKELSQTYQLQFEQAGWSGVNAASKVVLIRILLQFVGLLVCTMMYLFKDDIMPKDNWIALLIYLFVFYIFFKLYDFSINHIIKKRYQRLQRTLSFSVDLLSICVRAGYSLDRAFEIIAEEVSYYNMEMCVEFMKVSIELSVIPDRKEALRNFYRRVDLPLTKVLVTGLIQSEEQGASMGQTLTHLSQDFSKQKIAEIDEMASKIPTKILLPMAVFCMPGFLLFLMGPIIANISRSSFMN